MSKKPAICKIGSEPYKELALKILALPYVTSIKRAEDFIMVKSGRTAFAIQIDEDDNIYVNPQDARFFEDSVIYPQSRFLELGNVSYADSSSIRTVDSLEASLLKTFEIKSPQWIHHSDGSVEISFYLSGCLVTILIVDDQHSLRASLDVIVSADALVKDPQICTVIRRYLNVQMMELIPIEVFGTDTYIFYRK